MTDYHSFLASKRSVAEPCGFAPHRSLNPMMKPHQRVVCAWNLQRGRSADFLDTGLGKTLIELEWGRHVNIHTAKPTLLLTPLAVGQQMVREAAKFNIDGVSVVKPGGKLTPISISNYEKLHRFNPSDFGGLVIDESGILKSFDGSTRKAITEFGKAIPFRLAATATPAPNDLIELTNHAEFLDILTAKEIKAHFFTQDGNDTSKWRLKGHAREPFWRWMASWSVAIRKPSDLGFDDTGYDLPELRTFQHTVKSKPKDGWLLATEAASLQERRQARRASLTDRVSLMAGLVNGDPGEPWIIWRKLLDEADALKAAIPGSMEIRGADGEESRLAKLEAFADGRLRVLITDPSIAGFGLNWQHCARVGFVGLDDSFESQYQAIRRCYRFGQTRPVDVHFVCSEAEGAVVENLRRKERQATEMFDQIVKHMAGLSIGQARRDEDQYNPSVQMELPMWLQQELAA